MPEGEGRPALVVKTTGATVEAPRDEFPCAITLATRGGVGEGVGGSGTIGFDPPQAPTAIANPIPPSSAPPAQVMRIRPLFLANDPRSGRRAAGQREVL